MLLDNLKQEAIISSTLSQRLKEIAAIDNGFTNSLVLDSD